MRKDDRPQQTPGEGTDPNMDQVSPDDQLSGNQQQAYAARHPREVLDEGPALLDRARQRQAGNHTPR